MEKYDELCNISMINLYTLSKKEKKIKLSNFDFKNKKHLYLLSIAKILNTLYGYKICIQSNFVDYIKYKIKHMNKYIKYKRKMLNGIEINSFLNHITTAQKLDENIWIDIYNVFFKGGNK